LGGQGRLPAGEIAPGEGVPDEAGRLEGHRLPAGGGTAGAGRSLVAGRIIAGGPIDRDVRADGDGDGNRLARQRVAGRQVMPVVHPLPGGAVVHQLERIGRQGAKDKLFHVLELALDAPHGEAAFQVALDPKKDEQDGDDDQDRAGGEPAPRDVDLIGHLEHADHDGLFGVGGRDEDIGEKELAPAGHKAKEGGHGEHRPGERQPDVEEGLDRAAAVDHARLFEFDGDRVEIALEQPGGKDELTRHVGHNEAPVVAVEAQRAQDLGDGDQGEDAGKGLDGEKEDQAGLAQLEAKAGKGKAPVVPSETEAMAVIVATKRLFLIQVRKAVSFRSAR
jgi:hypothetical protein